MAKSKTKSVSVKKSLKTNKKKKFSLKNLDFKKNWKKLSYLGLAGFLTIASLGYGVWKNATEGSARAATYFDICVSGPNSSCNPATIYYCKIKLPSGAYTVNGFVSNRSNVIISNPTGYFMYPGGTVTTSFSGKIAVGQRSASKSFYSPGLPSVPGRVIDNCY